MRQAYRSSNADNAKELRRSLARRLREKHPAAAGSLEEGLDETLTVTRQHYAAHPPALRTPTPHNPHTELLVSFSGERDDALGERGEGLHLRRSVMSRYQTCLAVNLGDRSYAPKGTKRCAYYETSSFSLSRLRSSLFTRDARAALRGVQQRTRWLGGGSR